MTGNDDVRDYAAELRKKHPEVPQMDKVVVSAAVLKNMQYNTLLANLNGWACNVGLNLFRGKGKRLEDFKVPKDRQKETIFIVGPGASMIQYKDDLPKLRDHGYVIMQPTAYPWMTKIGLKPDLVVSVDHMLIQDKLIKGWDGPLIAPTTCDKDLSQYDVHWFTLYMGDGSPKPNPDDPLGVFYAHWNQLMNKLHKYTWGAHGWTSHMDVTNMCVDIADTMIHGADWFPHFGKRIVLVGADRSFWNGYSRVPWEGLDPAPFKADMTSVEFKGKWTNYQMVFYVYGLYEMWRIRKFPLFRLDHGIMEEIPFVPMADILAEKYPAQLGDSEMMKLTEKFILEDFADFAPYMAVSPEEAGELFRKVEKMREAGSRDYEMEAVDGPEERIRGYESMASSDSGGPDSEGGQHTGPHT